MLILFTGLGQHYQHTFLQYEMSQLNKNPTLLKIQFSNWNAWTPFNEFLRAPKCFVDKQITNYKKLQFLQYYCDMSN